MPRSGSTSRAAIFSSVDLPEPLRPTSDTRSLVETDSSAPVTFQVVFPEGSSRILFNYADTSSLLDWEAGVGQLARRPAVIGLLAGPAALLALAAVLALRRRAARLAEAEGPEVEPQEPAPPARPAGAGSAEEALAACRELLKTRLGLPPGRLTWQDVQAELTGRGLEPELVEQTRELFDRHERRSYGGAGQEPAEEERALAERAVRLAEQLDHRLE